MQKFKIALPLTIFLLYVGCTSNDYEGLWKVDSADASPTALSWFPYAEYFEFRSDYTYSIFPYGSTGWSSVDGNYSFTGDSLFLTNSYPLEAFKVVELSSNNLVIAKSGFWDSIMYLHCDTVMYSLVRE